MNIEYTLNQNKSNSFANFASFDSNLGELIIRTTPYTGNQLISLENIRYAIINNNILYIEGTQIFWENLWDWDEVFDHKSGEKLKLRTYQLEYLEIPEEWIIRNQRWGFFRKKQPVIDVKKNPYKYYFKQKRTSSFSYCVNPFKLREL